MKEQRGPVSVVGVFGLEQEPELTDSLDTDWGGGLLLHVWEIFLNRIVFCGEYSSCI